MEYIKDDKIKKFFEMVFVLTIISALSYLPMIANGYTNSSDGLWKPSYFQAGNWELSIGRWAWLFLDKLREGYAAEPLNPILTLILISISMLIIFSIFGNRKSNIILALFVLISTTVCCFLSYKYMSPTFGASVLLPVLASKLSIDYVYENRMQVVIQLGLVCLLMIVGLGLYQANVGCYCVIILFYCAKLILEDKAKNAFRLLNTSIVCFMVSCIAYKILWDVALKLRHTDPSWYKGIGNLTVFSIIFNIPIGILNSYNAFAEYYFTQMSYYVFFPVRVILIVLLIGVLIFLPFKRKLCVKDKVKYFFILILIPIGASICYILSANSEPLQMQMTMPILFVIPLALSIAMSYINYKIVVIIGCLLLYGNIYAVGTDVDAIVQGNVASENLMSLIINDMFTEDLLPSEYEYAFVGNICDSPLFKNNENWQRASHYAQFGDIGTKPECVVDSYNGILDDLGLNGFMIVYGDEYEAILKSEELKDMAVYPDKGSIKKINDVVIIKVSDTY